MELGCGWNDGGNAGHSCALRKALCAFLLEERGFAAMNQVKLEGMLSHHFWGTYYATIYLMAKDASSAKDAQKVLGDSWERTIEEPNVLFFHGKDSELEIQLKRLEGFGADRKKMCSCAKSIDFGEPFVVVVKTIPNEQMKIFG